MPCLDAPGFDTLCLVTAPKARDETEREQQDKREQKDKPRLLSTTV